MTITATLQQASRTLTALLASVVVQVAAGAAGVAANGIAVGSGGELGALVTLAAESRVVHLKGDSAEHEGLFHGARLDVIRALHETAGFDVLVLPVGIFEGAWLNARLREGASAEEASTPVYKVWRESEEFLEILRYAGESNLEITGGLCRYHASGKELYTPHLIEFLERTGLSEGGLADRIRELWGGRSRLSNATPDHRRRALALADDLVGRVGGQGPLWEAHFLRNMKTFVELEMIRAGDATEPRDFGLEEKRQNLSWFLGEGYPDAKLIYWEGRGSSSELPTEATVFSVELTVID